MPEGKNLELNRFAISPSSRTHDSTKSGHAADEGQHGQTHHQKKTGPEFMGHYMVHNATPFLKTIYLLERLKGCRL
jgi:hypothetical protein